MTRISVDIDPYESGWKLRAVRAERTLEHMGADVDVRVSSSGGGLHIIGWLDDDLDHDEKLKIRAHLGDDENRIYMDEQRARVGHMTNVLWTSKGHKGEADDSFENVHDALRHIEMKNADVTEMAKRVVDVPLR